MILDSVNPMESSPGPGCHHLRGGSTAIGHVAGVLAVGPAFDVQDRRTVIDCHQADRRPVARNRSLRLAPNLWLIEDLSSRVLGDRDQSGAARTGGEKLTGQCQPEDECGTAAVVQVDHPGGFHAQPVGETPAAAVERHVG